MRRCKVKYEVEAKYEGGVLKLEKPLPLADGQRLHVSVNTELSRARRSYGLMGWTGEAATVDFFAMSPDLDLGEDPTQGEEP
jgi:predicted DNA-binding antitoxin AbrB/MazE fold protein